LRVLALVTPRQILAGNGVRDLRVWRCLRYFVESRGTTMTIKALSQTVLVIAISTCLLAGCGGGSMVRSDPPAPIPTSVPPSVPSGACPSPVAADCAVDISIDQEMTGGRQSDYALIKRGVGKLTLISQPDTFGPPIVDFRFSGGATVENGTLRVASSASLHSSVVVQTSGRLEVFGAVTGNATNHGDMLLSDVVVGNVVNDGNLAPGSSRQGEAVSARIEGTFSQTSAGTLDAVIGATSGGFVSVTGRADIDGTLRLVAYTDAFGPYPLPAAPLSLQVLHAGGGVFGQFANWTSPGLFIAGSVRYLGNDIFFDASSISAATVMAASHTGDALTWNAAGKFDAALVHATDLAALPHDGLTLTQRQFLASAASIQRLQDYGKAVQTFDSLSGYGHVTVTDALLQQAMTPASRLIAHIGNLHAGSVSGLWSAEPAMVASSSGMIGNERRGGADQWLSDRLLLGSSFGWSEGSLPFDRLGGRARDRSPQWDVYLRRNGERDSYLLGDVGYGRHQLDLDRQIDLGSGQYNARARRNLDVVHAYVEAGRDFRVGQGWLTPFGALGYAALHGAAFTEQGTTGFELIAQPSVHQRTSAAAGLRFGRDWRGSDGRWTQLNVAAGYQRLLDARDDAFAAFTGAPEVKFAFDGMPRQRNSGWLHLSLVTGGERWAWMLNYDRQASDETLSLGVKLGF
jgi:uncharacterized protein with beta-barrel porin domain